MWARLAKVETKASGLCTSSSLTRSDARTKALCFCLVLYPETEHFAAIMWKSSRNVVDFATRACERGVYMPQARGSRRRTARYDYMSRKPSPLFLAGKWCFTQCVRVAQDVNCPFHDPSHAKLRQDSTAGVKEASGVPVTVSAPLRNARRNTTRRVDGLCSECFLFQPYVPACHLMS